MYSLPLSLFRSLCRSRPRRIRLHRREPALSLHRHPTQIPQRKEGSVSWTDVVETKPQIPVTNVAEGRVERALVLSPWRVISASKFEKENSCCVEATQINRATETVYSIIACFYFTRSLYSDVTCIEQNKLLIKTHSSLLLFLTCLV